MVQIYEQVVSDIGNKDTQFAIFLHWLLGSHYLHLQLWSGIILADRICAKLKRSHF